jgi:predicted O-methyltransferase YrrM
MLRSSSLQTLPVTQFDIIFLDANKEGYITYFKTILDRGLLAPGGIILADNTLKSALVVDASEKNPASKDWQILAPVVESLKAFNRFVMEDERVEQFLLPAFDGLNMARYKK